MNMVKLTEKQRRFISTKFHDEKKKGKKIIEEFGEKFSFIPSATTIMRYQDYNKTTEEREVKPKEEKPIVEAKVSNILNDDDLYDFSSGEISDEAFDKLFALTGKSKKKLFDLLKQCYDKGLTKINLKTGDVSK